MKNYIYPSQRVGITEAGEPAFNLDLFKGLYRANIIITKSLTDSLIEKLIEYKDKVILHLTCTGYGGTNLEPLVPTKEKTRIQLQKLLDKGFPASQIVLRIDPCIPTGKGRNTAYEVAKLFSDTGIKRLRFSILDMYTHVKERFVNANIPVPYTSFHASADSRKEVMTGLKIIGERYGYAIEACAEPGIKSIPCISEKDLEILGLNQVIELKSSSNQRSTCGCPANKYELIRNGRPHRCENKCVYCFWRDQENQG